MKYFYARLVVALLVIVLLIIAVVAGSSSKEKPVCDVVYSSYVVQAGDNLWTISETYNKVGMTTGGYVNLLQEINEIPGNYLKAGSSIIIVLPAKPNLLPTTSN